MVSHHSPRHEGHAAIGLRMSSSPCGTAQRLAALLSDGSVAVFRAAAGDWWGAAGGEEEGAEDEQCTVHPASVTAFLAGASFAMPPKYRDSRIAGAPAA